MHLQMHKFAQFECYAKLDRKPVQTPKRSRVPMPVMSLVAAFRTQDDAVDQ